MGWKTPTAFNISKLSIVLQLHPTTNLYQRYFGISSGHVHSPLATASDTAVVTLHRCLHVGCIGCPVSTLMPSSQGQFLGVSVITPTVSILPYISSGFHNYIQNSCLACNVSSETGTNRLLLHRHQVTCPRFYIIKVAKRKKHNTKTSNTCVTPEMCSFMLCKWVRKIQVKGEVDCHTCMTND